jgi:hypothetical protein
LLTFHTSSCVRFCILSGVNQSLSKWAVQVLASEMFT